MIYITDVTLFSIILCLISLIVVAFLFVKLRKYKPQIEDALSQKDEALAQIKEALDQKDEAFAIAEDIYTKSKIIIPLHKQLKKLFEDFTKALGDDGVISAQEFQALMAEASLIVHDPAFKELEDSIEGYTCSGQ